MLMGTGQSVAFDTLTVFYVYNLAILLGVAVVGGTLFIRRIQHGRWALFSKDSPRARNILLVGLSGLWILDGLLQMQPLLVTQFVPQLLKPLIPGQPTLVAHMLLAASHLWKLHPMSWDVGASWAQILLGLAIIFGDEAGWRRAGLWLSVVWSLVIWVAGEGLGSILSGGSWLLGSPGSVLFYGAAAGILLMRIPWDPERVASWWRRGMVTFWLAVALLQAWPAAAWWSSRQLGQFILTQAEMPQPAIVSAPLYAWAHLAFQHPVFWNSLLVVVFLALAVLWTLVPRSRATWGITMLTTFLTWWLGQDFGMFGGMGTDPNSGAIVLLGLVAYRSLTRTPATDQHREPVRTSA
ncbi:MAG: hypothetical protein M1272_05420 [Firmicutes bacterium]|nr:hypothetical protein [Bacillota bacterium]